MKRLLIITFKQTSSLLIVLLLLISGHTHSQNRGTSGTDTSGLKLFKDNWEKRFEQFKRENDSLFLAYLVTHWKNYKLFVDSQKPRVKPRFQPNISTGSQQDSLDRIKPDTTDKGKYGESYKMMIDSISEKNSLFINRANTTIDFYGENPGLSSVSRLQLAKPIDPFNIITFYRDYLEDPDLIKCFQELKRIADDIGLNDFGYFLLIEKASLTLFDGMNEKVLCTWITLSRIGKDVKLGYDEKSVYLLMACDYPLFDKQYIIINGIKYYLMAFPSQGAPKSDLKSYDIYYPGKISPVSIKLKKIPGLNKKIQSHEFLFRTDTIKINTSLFLVKFLRDLPASNLDYYFNSPVSDIVLKSMDKGLKPLLKDRSDLEKINLLLTFIQKSFYYKTDQEQFGKEKFMFCDESVYYPFTDCEDRSVLLAHLIRRYTSLPVVGLDYPDHVSVAVYFNTPMKGDHVIYDGKKYFICDPTYINAKAGMAPPSMRASKPEIIPIGQQQ
jgi:hypothetical protein